MTKTKAYALNGGDIFSFDLNMNTGIFKILKGDVVIAERKGLAGKSLRPTLSVYYPDDTIVNLKLAGLWKFGAEMKGN